MIMSKGVSVIVCCYNSALRLPETIRHIVQQETPAEIDWEVVIVNNSSTDNQISIYNSIGSLVWQETTAKTIVDVDLHSFSKGIYIVKINNNETNYTEKIVVQ